MENNDKGTKRNSKDNGNPDLWRNYRIVVGILTAAYGLIVGYLIIFIHIFIQMIFVVLETIIAFFSLSNMGGSPPSVSKDPTNPVIIVIAALCFLIFARAGYRYAKNSANSRLIIWITAILSMPLGIFTIWVLIRSAPETYHATSKNIQRE